MAVIAVEVAARSFLLLNYSAIGLNLLRVTPITEKTITGVAA